MATTFIDPDTIADTPAPQAAGPSSFVDPDTQQPTEQDSTAENKLILKQETQPGGVLENVHDFARSLNSTVGPVARFLLETPVTGVLNIAGQPQKAERFSQILGDLGAREQVLGKAARKRSPFVAAAGTAVGVGVLAVNPLGLRGGKLGLQGAQTVGRTIFKTIPKAIFKKAKKDPVGFLRDIGIIGSIPLLSKALGARESNQ